MRLSLCTFILFCLSSCATYKTAFTPDQYDLIEYKKIEKNEKCVSIPRVYSGVSYTACIMSRHIKTSGSQESLYMFPLNFLADTLILPYTITSQVIKGDIILKKEIPIKAGK